MDAPTVEGYIVGHAYTGDRRRMAAADVSHGLQGVMSAKAAQWDKGGRWHHAAQGFPPFVDNPVMRFCSKTSFAVVFIAAQSAFAMLPAYCAETRNLTGLPAYPNLNTAVMDGVFRTDTLGHWCMRFWAATSDPVSVVESWYKKSLRGLTEVDLRRDKTYQDFPGIVGVKLVLGIDYVVVYKTAGDAPTSIDLYRCSAP